MWFEKISACKVLVGAVGYMYYEESSSLGNMQSNHQASIIEMEGKICDRVVSILIDLEANYSYVNLDLVDKCGLRK